VEGTEPATGESEELCQQAAKGIVEYMFEHFYPEVQTPNVLPDLFGKLSQISNMVTGLARKPSPAAPPESESGLKPCPFCGGEVEFKQSHVLGEGGYIRHVHKNCGVAFAGALSHEDNAELIASWNRRAPSLSPELRGRMATVKALAKKADSGPWTAVLQRPVTIADKEGEKSIQIHLEEEPIHGTVRRVFYDDQRRRVTQFIAEANAHPHLKWQANTQYIAAASPDFVLKLIAALEGE
jgi:Lar family restriction alleviation protein